MQKPINDLKLTTPFRLFANCIPVCGFHRSIIVDLGRQVYYIVPKDLNKILRKFDGSTIQLIVEYFGRTNRQTVMQYFDFLFTNELIFFTSAPHQFPTINFSSWKHPSEIYQAIIDIKSEISINLYSVLKSLDNLNCKYVDLRIYEAISFSKFKVLLEHVESTSIIGLNIYVKFISFSEVAKIRKLCRSFLRINNVFIYNSPKNAEVSLIGKNSPCNISLLKQDIKGCGNCGIISQKNFTVNINAFTESMNYNSCLNKKIGIDINGEIKNCPSMNESFGNISNITLEEALKKRNFKRNWSITKDQVKVCKNCEFRYICTDCRAYLEIPEDRYSKPLKCGYDPYTGQWEKWSTNSLKKKAIIHYGLSEMISS